MVDLKTVKWEDIDYRCHCGKSATYGYSSIDMIEWIGEDGEVCRKAFNDKRYFCSKECCQPGKVYKVDSPPVQVV